MAISSMAPLIFVQRPKVGGTILDMAIDRSLQTNEVPQQRAFAAATVPHDDEHFAGINVEIEVTLNHKIAIGHFELFDGDSRRGHQTPNTLVNTENIAVVTMIAIIPLTTALVVASPTAEALRPLCIPCIQPVTATKMPKILPLTNPSATSPMSIA